RSSSQARRNRRKGLAMPLAMFDLTGKTVIVTGAGRGLGRAMADGIAAAGAATVVAGRTEADVREAAAAIEAAGGRAHAIVFDATRRADVERLVAETVTTFGGLDGIVVNHGVGLAKPADAVTDEDWDRVLDVNLKSAFVCAQVAGRRMVAQGAGSIVFVSSTASLVGFDKLVAYGASKGGMDQMVRQLAVEWGARGVRVNAINPGYTTNDMRGTEKRHAAAELNAEMRRLTPMQRRGTPGEFAGPAVFLLAEASSFVNGVCLAVDGGYCAM
ncbi:MAG: SDR family NAD(P)-dependent oxidoreductase, partial [Alphaproteobacteria bacterium]